MAAIHNDGSVPYGSVELTIPTAGTAYVARNVTVTRPTKKLEQNNHLGEPKGFVLVAGFVTASANIQLDNGDTIPALGDTFTHTFDSEIGSETFVISSVGTPLDAEGLKFVDISFDKAYN